MRKRAIFVCFSLIFLMPAILSAAPMLWQVKGAQTFYVMGTIHLPDPRVNTLPESTNKVFQLVDAFYTEIKLDAQLQQSMGTASRLQDGRTLFELIPESLLQRINLILAGMRPPLSIEPFANQKIWVLAVTLPMLQTQLNYPNELPQDQTLYLRAEQTGKRTGGLETMEEQLAIFESLTVEEQVKLLADTVDYMEQAELENRDLTEDILTAYLRGDLDRLNGIVQAYTKDEPFYNRFMEKILTERNFIMAERMSSIVEHHQQERILFAVGSAHLAGEFGVLTLLEQLGYQVRRLQQ